MVRLSCTVHPQTKEYEWKILSSDNAVMLDIQTPDFNRLIIRNFPRFEDSVKDEFDTIPNSMKKYGEESPQLKQRLTKCLTLPVAQFFIVDVETDEDFKIYHPVQCQFVHGCYEQEYYFLQAVEVDLLNHVLQYDEMIRRRKIEEHNSRAELVDILKSEARETSRETSQMRSERSGSSDGQLVAKML